MEATKRELVLAAAVFLTLPLLGEVALRVSKSHFEPQLYAPNRDRGWTLRPGVSGIVSTETPQFVRINSQGFRDREHSIEKPANTIRIAVLGNSWTEALQVPLEKTFPAALETALSHKDCFNGKQIEVLNFGVAGYSTAQQLLTLQQTVWKYTPDVVLLAFYPARDIANNIREFNNAANPDQSPYFVYRDGELKLDDAFRSSPALQTSQIRQQNLRFVVNQHSQLLQAVNALQTSLKMRIALLSAKEKAEKTGVENLEYAIYSPPSTPAMQEAWRVTEGLFEKLNEESKAHGADFRIVVLATRPEVIPNEQDRLALEAKLGVSDFSYADQRLQNIAADHRIPIILLGPPLAQYAVSHHVYLNGFNVRNQGTGHWNETGHALAAQVIASELCKDNRDLPKTQGSLP